MGPQGPPALSPLLRTAPPRAGPVSPSVLPTVSGFSGCGNIFHLNAPTPWRGEKPALDEMTRGTGLISCLAASRAKGGSGGLFLRFPFIQTSPENGQEQLRSQAGNLGLREPPSVFPGTTGAWDRAGETSSYTGQEGQPRRGPQGPGEPTLPPRSPHQSSGLGRELAGQDTGCHFCQGTTAGPPDLLSQDAASLWREATTSRADPRNPGQVRSFALERAEEEDTHPRPAPRCSLQAKLAAGRCRQGHSPNVQEWPRSLGRAEDRTCLTLQP